MKILRVSSCQVPWVVLGKERFRKKKGTLLESIFWGFISIRCWWDWLMWWLFDFIGILKYGPLRKLLGYLEKAFPSIYMPTRPQVKSFGRHKRWVGWKGCGWPISGEVLILQFKVFFWTYAEHCCFHLLCHFYFQFSTHPRHTEFNLLYLDFSFSEIGVGPAFHRFTFFLLIPWPSRFLN